jgi:fatty-acyl-CoA synthase
MQLEPPTLSLGVPTIWMGLIQTYDAAQARTRRTTAAGSCRAACARWSAGGGAGALIRAFDRHGIWIEQGWGMTETSPVCTDLYPRAELRAPARREVPARRDGRRAGAAGGAAGLGDAGELPWDGKSVGEIQVRGPFITGSYHEVPADKFTADGWLRTGDVASVDDSASCASPTAPRT